MGESETLVDRVTSRFTEVVGDDPRGVWTAPTRINLIGDHSDSTTGFVLSIAIDRSAVVAVGLRDDGAVRLVSPDGDTVTIDLQRCVPGSISGWAAAPLGVLWALGGSRGGVSGLDIVIDSDIPASPDFSVATAIQCALSVAVNDVWDMDLGRMELVLACQRADSEMVGKRSPVADSIVGLSGELDSAVLVDCLTPDASIVPFPLDAAGLALLVIVTDFQRSLGGSNNHDREAAGQRAAESLGVETLRDIAVDDLPRVRETQDEETYRRVRHVVTENARVLGVVDLLWSDGPRAIGDFLVASHLSMSSDFDVRNSRSDTAVRSAWRAGALGARKTGGGLGGVAIALVPTERLAFVERKIRQAFIDERFADPEILVVTPTRGAHRVF
jgi:galactokinase